MPQKKTILLPPIKGWAESSAFVAQPEGTSPDIRNVMLLDPSTERFRPAVRPGAGLFDLFDFHNGHTISYVTVTIPADGIDATDPNAPAVNIPNRDCYTLTTSGPLLDVTQTGNCGATTIQIGGLPNQGGPYTGGIIVTGSTGSKTIPVQHGSGSTFIPSTDNHYRPWLRVTTCAGAGAGFWVDQSAMGRYNAVPVLGNSVTLSVNTAITLEYHGTAGSYASVDIFEPLANQGMDVLTTASGVLVLTGSGTLNPAATVYASAGTGMPTSCTLSGDKQNILLANSVSLSYSQGTVTLTGNCTMTNMSLHKVYLNFAALPLAQSGESTLTIQGTVTLNFSPACYQVTGQRTDNPNFTRSLDTFVYYPTCAPCASPTNVCYYIFTQTYNCETGLWGTVTYSNATCLLPTAVPAANAWVAYGSTSTAVRSFAYYSGGATSCSVDGDCISIPTAPGTQTGAPATCALGDPCDASCCQFYTYAFLSDDGDTSRSGLAKDTTSGLYYLRGPTGGGLQWSGGSQPCDVITTHSGSWLLDSVYLGNAGSLTAASTCPPRTTAGWTVGGAVTLVEWRCVADVPDCSTLPDVLILAGLAGKIKWDVSDDATRPIWNGTLLRDSGCVFVAAAGNNTVRVLRSGTTPTYAAVTIRVTSGIVYINGTPAFLTSSDAGMAAKYGLSSGAFAAFNDLNRLLPLSVEVHT